MIDLTKLFFGTDVINRTGRKNIRGDELAAAIGASGAAGAYSSMQPGFPQGGTPDIQYAGPTSPGSPVGMSGMSFVGPEQGITGLLSFPQSFLINEGTAPNPQQFLVIYQAHLQTFGGFTPSDPGIEWECWHTINGTDTTLRGVGTVPSVATESAFIGIAGTLKLEDGDVVSMLADPQSGVGVHIGGRGVTWSIMRL